MHDDDEQLLMWCCWSHSHCSLTPIFTAVVFSLSVWWTRYAVYTGSLTKCPCKLQVCSLWTSILYWPSEHAAQQCCGWTGLLKRTAAAAGVLLNLYCRCFIDVLFVHHSDRQGRENSFFYRPFKFLIKRHILITIPLNVHDLDSAF